VPQHGRAKMTWPSNDRRPDKAYLPSRGAGVTLAPSHIENELAHFKALTQETYMWVIAQTRYPSQT